MLIQCFTGVLDEVVEGKQRKSSLSEFHPLDFHQLAGIIARECVDEGLVAVGRIDHEAKLRASGIADPVGVYSVADFEEACGLGGDLPVLKHSYLIGQFSFLLGKGRRPLALRAGVAERSTTPLHSQSTLEQQSKPIRNINIKNRSFLHTSKRKCLDVHALLLYQRTNRGDFAESDRDYFSFTLLFAGSGTGGNFLPLLIFFAIQSHELKVWLLGTLFLETESLPHLCQTGNGRLSVSQAFDLTPPLFLLASQKESIVETALYWWFSEEISSYVVLHYCPLLWHLSEAFLP